MGRKYLNVIQARTQGSLCRFQLPLTIPLPPLPGIPAIPIPKIPPPLPTINTFCPFDDAEEVVPTS